MARTSKSSDEYELMPVRPLVDLRNEVAKLRKELQKEDKMHDIMIKILNSNVETQRQVMETMRRVEDVKNALGKFTDVVNNINEIEEAEDETDDKINDMMKKINLINDNQQKIMNVRVEPIQDDLYHGIRKLPRGTSIVYRRTKNE